MAKVQVNQVAPDFTLPDFRGQDFHLASLKGQQAVLLVFNRGFT